MGSRRSCAGPAQVDEREKCVRARCPEREATGRCQRVYDTGEPGAPRRAETGAPHVGVPVTASRGSQPTDHRSPVAVRTVVRSDGTVRPVWPGGSRQALSRQTCNVNKTETESRLDRSQNFSLHPSPTPGRDPETRDRGTKRAFSAVTSCASSTSLVAGLSSLQPTQHVIGACDLRSGIPLWSVGLVSLPCVSGAG